MNPRSVLKSWWRTSRLFVLGVLWCGVLGPAAAVTFSSRLWQMEDGLPHNIVQAITQTRDGYLWVGTREGLARFDGVRFKVVELSPEARHPSVFVLLEGADGSLWVGTENAGLFRVHQGQITFCPGPDRQNNYSVYDLRRSGDSVWAATSLGILEWAGGKLVHRSDFRNLIEALCVDSTGGVWLVGEELRRLNGVATNYAIPGQLLSQGARRAYCDPAGTFWIATGNGIVEIRNGVAAYHRKADGPAGFVSVMYRDHAGEFWVGSYSGLGRYSDGQFVSQDEAADTSYQVSAIAEDREGSVWVGSEEGLTRFTPKAFKTYTKHEGLTLNRVVTVFARQDGSVWVGLHGGGLNHFVGDRFEPFDATHRLASDFIMAMGEGHDGSLWVGTDYGSTLNHLEGDKITTYGPKEGFVTAVTTAILEDREGNIWAGTRDGLQCLRAGQFICYTASNGLPQDKINALAARQKGGIWIGTAGGLCCWNDGQFTNLAARDETLSAPILSLHEAADGTLWLGTKGRGLLRWKGNQIEAFASDQGLSSDSIYAVLEDHRGNLWLNGSRGIFCVSLAELDAVAAGKKLEVNSITYGKADGILCSGQYGEVTQPTACRGMDGRLWFRTTQGVAMVDPEKMKLNHLPPEVAIEEIIADRKTVAEAPLLGVLGPVTVPKGRGELEIRYTALSLRAPEKNRFRYRLSEVDLDWVEAGARRSAFYSKLAPGQYRFEVTACNNDGVWDEKPAVVDLQLAPHFWQTRTFLFAGLLLFVSVIAGTVRYTTWRKMQRQVERLKQQNAVEQERARIARDIHDDIGAGLTEIALTSEMVGDASLPAPEARQLAGEISTRARELVAGMDEIVWAINPRNDTLKSAAAYFSQFAQRLLTPAGIRCRLDIDPALPAMEFSSEERHNLFLGFKEAINNVIKHAKATEVKVGVRIEAGAFTVTVQDDGSGMIPGAPAVTADGLINLRERMTKLGGDFEISSQPGAGTRVIFRLPLPDLAAAHDTIGVLR